MPVLHNRNVPGFLSSACQRSCRSWAMPWPPPCRAAKPSGHMRCEGVSLAMHGADDRGACGVLFKLAAKTADQNIDGAGIGAVLAVRDPRKQRVKACRSEEHTSELQSLRRISY